VITATPKAKRIFWSAPPGSGSAASSSVNAAGLKESKGYKALLLDGRLLDIVLPPQIALKVVDTAPPSRTDLNSSWKEAKLETGLQIMVPLFIAKGETIRVDTAGKKYLGKETSQK
jgi:elongation factor P